MMAVDPSLFHYSIPNLLAHLRLPISQEACAVLTERDSALRRDTELLRSEIYNLQVRYATLNRQLEEEISVRGLRDAEIFDREENEQLMRQSNLELSAELKMVEEEVSMLQSAAKVSEMQEEELLAKVEALLREKKEAEALICKVKRENGRILEENRRLEEEVKVKIPMLAETNQTLRKEIGEKDEEIRKVRSEKGVINAKNGVLEKEKGLMAAELGKLKRKIGAVEKAEVETRKKNAELVKMNEALMKEKGEMEAEFQKKKDEIERVLNEKVGLEADKNRIEKELKKEKAENKSINKRIVAVEEENTKLIKLIEVSERDRGALEAEVSKREMERDSVIRSLQNVKEALEDEMRIMEKEKAEKVSVLEREKAELEAEVQKAKKDNSELNKALDTQLRWAERASEELKEIEDLKRVKGVLIAKIVKVDRDSSEEIERIFLEKMDLEREKAELEAEVCKMKKDKNNECERIVELSKALKTQEGLAEEMDQQVSGFLETIMGLEREKETLEREKGTLEDGILKLYKEKSEDIRRIEVLEREKKEMEAKIISNQKMAVKDNYGNKNLTFAERINILVREKRGLEAEIMLKDEAIKALDKENRLLEDGIQEPEMGINVLSTPLQNEGQNTNKMTRKKACKRKRSIRECEQLGRKMLKPVLPQWREAVPCENNTEMNSTRHTIGGEVEVACEWKFDQDLLDAFDVNPELCLKAICALYRRHMRLPDSTNTSLSDEVKTFATYLIDEVSVDNRMKKLVGKLEKLDDLAVGVCRNIAKEHYKQVFEIIKKKEDPLFFC